jgi:maltose O-acetyltransferase
MGQGAVICDNVKVYNAHNVFVGRHVRINDQVLLHACEGARVLIEDNVVLSYRCMLLTGSLDLRQWPVAQGHSVADVSIGEGAWIGAGAIILPGTSVGKCSIVAAGSVVTRDVPEYTLVAGNPAKAIRQLATESAAANEAESANARETVLKHLGR